MDPRAVQKATVRLERMRQAAAALKGAQSPSDMERAWVDFITAAGTLYNALEQGSKTNPKSIAWFGRVKHLRRTDQLLRYIHHARNAEEHGLAAITKVSNSHVSLKSQGATVILQSDGKSWNVIGHTDGVEFPQDTVSMVPVYDLRFGDRFDPPEEHLGKQFQCNIPHPVVEMALSYFESLLLQAAALPN